MSQVSIVVLMCDDLSVSLLGDALARGLMPNLQEHIITPGTKFARSYVTTPLCSPSRATFWTGRLIHNHGVWSNGPAGGWVGTFDDSSTLLTWLKAAGYTTGHVGKVHIGMYGANLTASPKDDASYVWPGCDDWQAILVPADPGDGSGGNFNYDLNDNGTVVHYGEDEGEYSADVLAERAAQFIEETPGLKFLTVAFPQPHVDTVASCTLNVGATGMVRPAPRHDGSCSTVPLPQALDFNHDDPAKPAHWRFSALTSAHIDCIADLYRSQMESLRAVDDAIGVIVAALGNEDAALCFTSDNGFIAGGKRWVGKGPAWEEGIRVPLYWRVPGGTAGVTQRLVANIDLAPTIMALAETPPGLEPDGRSLLPLIANPIATPWRKRILLMSRTGQASGFSGIRTDPLCVATPNELYVEHSTGDKELYPCATDVYQLANLGASGVSPWPAHRAAHAGLLAQMRVATGSAYRALEDA